MPLKLLKRGKTWYLRGTVRGYSVYETTGTDDADAADQIRIKREASILDDSVHGRVASATFIEAAISYLASGGSKRYIGTEINGKWTGLIGHFMHRKLSSIGQSDLDEAGLKLYPNTSAATRNRQCYTPFIAIWNHAVRNKWAEQRPWARPRKVKGTNITVLKKKRSGTRPVDYERAAKFVLAMSPGPAMIMTTLFYTGMRPIEVFSMKAPAVDIEKRWLVLESSKTGEPRGVPLHEFLVPLFTALVARGGVLFRTPRGEPYPFVREDIDGGGQLKTAINGARRRSGIADISPYTARHTVSTQLVINGVHHHIKDQILGHAADDMSRHYTHVPQRPLIDAINTLPVPDAWRRAEWWEDPVVWSTKLAKWGKESKKAAESA